MSEDSLGFPILTVRISNEHDIVTARQKTRRIAELLGFKARDQIRLATAVSELTRNMYQYARGGMLDFMYRDCGTPMLFARAHDDGPGIACVDDILAGTYQSATGMGLGLIGTKKLMDYFAIETVVGRGSAVTIGKSNGATVDAVPRAQLARIAASVADEVPTTAYQEIQRQNQELVRALDDLRVTQSDLRDLNRELNETNRGVVALYAELDEKAASLQRANIIKTRFLSNVTHEFRTPLSSILSLVNLLQLHVDGPLTPEQERQVGYIRKSGEGLLELVNDLLDVAKVDAGKITINAEDFTLDELMSGLRGMFRPLLAPGGEVEFTVDWDPALNQLRTDQGKVSQILRNLVSNALKFTARGSVVVSAAPDGPDAVCFSVADTGVGILPEHLEFIFEDFAQIESSAQTSKGTGLGLPLSRRLAELLGGRLWLESVPGRGSTFYASIPRRYGGGTEAILIPDRAAPTLTNEDLRRDLFNVLIIDDDEPSRYLIKNLVSNEIHACFTEAPSGRAGLDRLAGTAPDLIILDLNMPGLSGFELLRSIRNIEGARHVPVVVNTARALTAAEEEYLAGAVTAVLSKDRSDQQLAVNHLRLALAKSGFDYKDRHVPNE